MKSSIFATKTDKESRSCLKRVFLKEPEVASLLTYKGCSLAEESQSKKPTNNKISKSDLVQKNTLTGLAKVYSARIMKSEVSMDHIY